MIHVREQILNTQNIFDEYLNFTSRFLGNATTNAERSIVSHLGIFILRKYLILIFIMTIVMHDVHI